MMREAIGTGLDVIFCCQANEIEIARYDRSDIFRYETVFDGLFRAAQTR